MREHANTRFKANCSSNKFRFQRCPVLQLSFYNRTMIMWIIKLVLFVLIGQINCDVDAKVEVIKLKSTTTTTKTTTPMTQIYFSNNGKFKPELNVTSSHRISTYEPQMTGQCGGIFRNTQNLIASPKFISARPICNLRCEYQIVSPYICENEFHVQFLEFSIDSSVDCEHDRVIIDRTDVLCGKLLGVKKYRTTEGVLNITFVSNSWDSTGKGFKLLITRQPCVVEENQIEVEPSLGMVPAVDADKDTNWLHHVNASISVADPSYEHNGHPVYGIQPAVEYNLTSSRQDIPVVPLPTPPPPPYPFPFPFPTTQSPIYPFPPPSFPPQCCRNVYNQQRFLMFSQGFPAYFVMHNDCTFVIHKSSIAACRLRIHFKYFLLDDVNPQQAIPGQVGCFNNFIEIDGQRICGCKTDFIYETQWGLEPKIIRLRTTPGSYRSPQGFVFHVEQLDCPFKIQQASGNTDVVRVRRTLLTSKLLLAKKHLVSSHLTRASSHGDVDEGFHAKFFNLQNNPNGFINNVCTLNHLRLLHLQLETFGIMKHYCMPAY